MSSRPAKGRVPPNKRLLTDVTACFAADAGSHSQMRLGVSRVHVLRETRCELAAK